MGSQAGKKLIRSRESSACLFTVPDSWAVLQARGRAGSPPARQLSSADAAPLPCLSTWE